MITDHVLALRLPPDHADGFLGAAGPARGDVEDRGDLDPAPPARGPAAAAAASAETGLGGPGPARCPARRHTESAAPGTAAAGYPGHDRALAPRHRPPPLGRQVRVRQDRPASDPAQHPGTGPAAGSREPRLGVSQDPRRAGRTRRKGRSVYRVGDPQGQRHRSRPTGDRAGLVTIPALPGRGHPGAAFFTADLPGGTQAYVLAAIEHATRRIRIIGITLHPTGEWTAQQARNLLMDLDEQAHRVKFMIRDRGSCFTAAFDAVLADADIRTVLCNIQTPRMNAITERWIGGCRRDLLDRTLVWNQTHLRQILHQYETHHNQHRPHRSLHGAAPLKPLPEPVDLDLYRIRKQAHAGGMTWTRLSARTVLGGLVNEYERSA